MYIREGGDDMQQAASTGSAPSEATTKLTRALLACGVVAGPFYIVVGVLQLFIRPGFDNTRHMLSLLANGDLGWIQITNFEVSGLLTIAGAIGIRQGPPGGSPADSRPHPPAPSAFPPSA